MSRETRHPFSTFDISDGFTRDGNSEMSDALPNTKDIFMKMEMEYSPSKMEDTHSRPDSPEEDSEMGDTDSMPGSLEEVFKTDNTQSERWDDLSGPVNPSQDNFLAIDIIPKVHHINMLPSLNAHPMREEITGNREPLEDLHTLRHLPIDILVHFLSFVLVAPGPIANPWLPSKHRRGPSADFQMFLRPNILATCKRMHEIGMPILYGENTFCVTCDHDRSLKHKILKYSLIGTFLSFPFRSLLPLVYRQAEVVRRHALIKKMILQRDDRDSDELASKGLARPVPTDRVLNFYESWQYCTLRTLEIRGLQLQRLTLTIDQEWLWMEANLGGECRLRQLSDPTSFDTFVTLAEAKERNFNGDWTIDYILGRANTLVAKAEFGEEGMAVHKVIVRGTADCDSAAAYLQNSLLGRTAGLHVYRCTREIDTRAKAIFTNSIALQTWYWLRCTNIDFDYLEFSGGFWARIIMEDGTIRCDEGWPAVKKNDRTSLEEEESVPIWMEQNPYPENEFLVPQPSIVLDDTELQDSMMTHTDSYYLAC